MLSVAFGLMSGLQFGLAFGLVSGLACGLVFALMFCASHLFAFSLTCRLEHRIRAKITNISAKTAGQVSGLWTLTIVADSNYEHWD